ncbi:MAG: hypothetical protein DIU78_012880 [Pseudomonadota bacterium]
MATTVTYDAPHSPRVTLTKDGSVYTAVIEVEGLDPQRDTSADERRVGVRSLNPPTVRATSSRRLIDAACRAVAASATSTLGETGGPGGLAMTHWLVTRAVKEALRLLGEDGFSELPADTDPIVLWIVQNDAPISVVGYSQRQLRGDRSRAAPAVFFDIDYGSAWGHGITQLRDGTLIVATSEDTGGNGNEGWYVVQSPTTRSGTITDASPGVRRILARDFVNWPSPNWGARSALELPDGRILLTRGLYGVILTPQQLYGRANHRDATYFLISGTDLGGVGWGAAVVGDSVLAADDRDGIALAPIADLASGSPAATKIALGPNIADRDLGASDTGLGVAIHDGVGGIVWTRWDEGNQSIRRYSPSVVAGLSDTPSDPTPTILTTTAIPETALFAIGRDREHFWVATYEEPCRVLAFTEDQVFAGGVQSPVIAFQTPIGWANGVAIAPEFAP